MRVKANLSAQIPILGKLANKYPLPLKKRKHIKEINMALKIQNIFRTFAKVLNLQNIYKLIIINKYETK